MVRKVKQNIIVYGKAKLYNKLIQIIRLKLGIIFHFLLPVSFCLLIAIDIEGTLELSALNFLLNIYWCSY